MKAKAATIASHLVDTGSTRDAQASTPSIAATGSGVQPHRLHFLSMALATLILALLACTPQSHAKVLVDSFGPAGTLGGQLGGTSGAGTAGVAVNSSGAGGVDPGTVYVLDENNKRIQRFSPDGDFERLWGFDVIAGGGTGFEICTVAADCKVGTASDTTANGGQIATGAGNRDTGLAVDPSTGHAYVYESDNRRVTEFDADGNFIRAWGWDVVMSTGGEDVSANDFEICAVATNCKQAAVSGEDGGRFGGGSAGNHSLPEIGPTGDLWVPDPGNRRIQRFESDGDFVAAYGWDVDATGGSGQLEACTSTVPGDCQAAMPGSAPGQFTTSVVGAPSVVAFDSAGNLYANDDGRLQRFDPTLATATEFATGTLTGVTRVTKFAAAADGERLALAVGGAVEEYDLAGNLVETSIPGFGLSGNGVGGLGEDSVSGDLYVTASSSGLPLPDNVLRLGDAPPPVPSLDPVTVFDDSSATLTGTVDPMGGPVSCNFQYSEDQVEWIDAPEDDCATLDPDAGSQTVSVDIDGLEPGSPYFARLQVARPLDTSTTVNSSEEEFTALSLPPVLSGVGAVQITDTSAYLVGVVLPRSQLTDYVFQYTTTDFADCGTAANPDCLETPSSEIIGSAETVVAQQATGLDPDADYDFRLIATNVAGTTESGIESFHTRADPLPDPDGRGYEQVTPVDKNFGDADAFFGNGRAASDGQGVTFTSGASFADPAGQSTILKPAYTSRRGPGGWQTGALNPPFCSIDFGSTEDTVSVINATAASSPNLDRAVLRRPEFPSCPIPPLDPAAPLPGGGNLYLADYTTDPIGYQLLTPAGTGVFEGADADFSNVVYSSNAQQTAGAPAGGFAKLYEWDGSTLRLVSRDPGGNPLMTASGVPNATGGGTSSGPNPVSADGSRIFFQNPSTAGGGCDSSACELYMRELGAATHHVSASECTSSCGASAADRFRAATPDGSKALFVSAAKLTDSDTSATGADLYLYTHSANPPADQNLTLLSLDSEPADGTSASVQGVLGMSEDGDTVFFAADGQLVPGEPTDPGVKVYRWSWNGGSPELEYLATRGSGASGQVSDDGAALLIDTTAAIDQFADHDSDRDLYLWTQAAGWQCLSCQVPADPSQGDVATNATMTADGERVFFQTPDSLVTGDTNAPVQDVYQWHDGALSLISSGIGTSDNRLIGTSDSGDDVFFYTRERLVGWDTDDNTDIYNARVGGGFPEPTPEPASCEGEACRGEGTDAPPPVGAGSAAFAGPPNQVSGGKVNRRACRKVARRVQKQSRVTKRLRRRAARAANPRQTKRLRRSARRFAAAAKKNSNRAKRCRRATRRAAR